METKIRIFTGKGISELEDSLNFESKEHGWERIKTVKFFELDKAFALLVVYTTFKD